MTTIDLINLKLLDEKNIDLYTDIVATETVETVLSMKSYYEVYTEGHFARIAVPVNRYSSTSFTHELLHIYLRTKGVKLGDSLYSSIRSNPSLSSIFSSLHLEEMTNSIDHIKTLPLYLQLGYPLPEFIDDFDRSQFSLLDAGAVAANFKKHRWFKTTYCRRGIELYIAKFFVAHAAPNPKFTYHLQLNVLKKLDPELYAILEKFLDAWKKFNYESDDPLERSYYRFSLPFIEALDQWVNNRNIKD